MSARHRTGDAAARVTTGDVVAFRLRGHHLTQKVAAGRLHRAAGACGVQDSPPGSALLALHARVEAVTPDRVEHLVGEDKTLLRTWCMRGSPYLFPTADAPVFTTGVLPTTETARLRLITGLEPALDTLGLGLDNTVERMAVAIGEVLAHRRLAIGELGAELADHVADQLTPAQRDTWRKNGPYGRDQPLGEAVAHFVIRILTLRGVVCFAPREANRAPFVLLPEWLGHRLPRTDPAAARADLLRRYLRCYGPSTRADFAAWLGVATTDVDPWWTTIADKLIPVDVDGRETWLHTEDLDQLRSAAEPRGVRLLPPSDPYTQQRDRDTIVDKTHQRAVWKPTGAPGTVLADGRIAGIWRPRKTGRTLNLTVEPFGPFGTKLRRRLREEAEHVGELRGAVTTRVDFA